MVPGLVDITNNFLNPTSEGGKEMNFMVERSEEYLPSRDSQKVTKLETSRPS